MRRAAEDLHDRVLVDGVLGGLTHELVRERAGILVEGDIGPEAHVVRPRRPDDEAGVAGETREVLRRRRHVPLHVPRARLQLLLHVLGGQALRDDDLVDVGVAQRVGGLVPCRIAHERETLVGGVLRDLVRPVGERVLAEGRAVGDVAHVLGRTGRAEREGEDVEEVRRGLEQMEDDRQGSGGDDARQVARLLIGIDRWHRVAHLGESRAVGLHPDDRAEEVAGGTDRRCGVAQHLELAHEIGGRHLPRGRGVPHHARLDVDRVRLASVADPAVGEGWNGGGSIGIERQLRGECRCVRVAEQLSREQPGEHVAHRVIGAHGVEVEDVALPEDRERATAASELRRKTSRFSTRCSSCSRTHQDTQTASTPPLCRRLSDGPCWTSPNRLGSRHSGNRPAVIQSTPGETCPAAAWANVGSAAAGRARSAMRSVSGGSRPAGASGSGGEAPERLQQAGVDLDAEARSERGGAAPVPRAWLVGSDVLVRPVVHE